jgi:hypothetical protein
MKPQIRAWRTRRGREAAAKAKKREKNAKTLAKYSLFKKGYKWSVALESKEGNEYKGIVDIVAVGRDRKDPDRLEVMLVQVKGGTARVTGEEIQRLRVAAKKVSLILAVVEKPGATVRLRTLP